MLFLDSRLAEIHRETIFDVLRLKSSLIGTVIVVEDVGFNSNDSNQKLLSDA